MNAIDNYVFYFSTVILTYNTTHHTQHHTDRENMALVESHQAYLQEMTIMYENKLKIEQSSQRDAQRDKEQLQVRTI